MSGDNDAPPEGAKASDESSPGVEPVSPSAAMVEAVGLTKYYGAFTAVRDVTFTVPRGQVAAFLGPNGAGKSTTMKLLTGFLAPSSGTARIAGFDVQQDRLEAVSVVGYLPENGPLYPEMSPEAILKHVAEVRRMPRAEFGPRLDFVAEKCSLQSVWRKPVGKLSKGYRQRVGMAQALLHDPDVLILDEPTAGLDPNQVHDVRELIRGLGKTKTILLSTHILQEVRAVCDRVLLVNEGQLVFDKPTRELAEDAERMEERFRELTLVG